MPATFDHPPRVPVSIPKPLSKRAQLREVHNLENGDMAYYSLSANPIAIVTHAFAHENQLMSQWTFANQDQDFSAFPVTVGNVSVACGNWCTRKQP